MVVGRVGCGTFGCVLRVAVVWCLWGWCLCGGGLKSFGVV